MMHPLDTAKVGVLFCGRQRPGFNPQWGTEAEGIVRTYLDGEKTYTMFYPSVRVVDAATCATAISECLANECDALIVIQGTMSDGRLAPLMAQRWGRPLIFWATGESPTDPRVSACSLVGAHTFTATLAQFGRPVLFVYGMPDESRCRERLADCVFTAKAWQKLRMGRVGLIGRHSPGYIDMDANPSAMSRTFGAELHYGSLHEYLALYNGLEAEALKADLAKVKAMGLPSYEVTAADLEMQSKFYLALKEFCKMHLLDCVATRCWPELSNGYQWPYLAFLRLGNERFQAAMEGDADGALTCWIGDLLGMGAGFLSDLLQHDESKMVMWHPGNAPFSMAPAIGQPGGPTLAPHFNVRKPCVVESDLPPGLELTMFRYWQVNGTYFWMGDEGQVEKDGQHFEGTCGTVTMNGGNLYDRMECWIQKGFPHHIALFPGHHLRRLERLNGLLNIQRVDC